MLKKQYFMDFSLTAPDPSFDPKAYFPILDSGVFLQNL